jgi:hypothetical protein
VALFAVGMHLLDAHSDDWRVLLCRQFDQAAKVILRPGIRAIDKPTAMDKHENWQFASAGHFVCASWHCDGEIQAVSVRYVRDVGLGKSVLDEREFSIEAEWNDDDLRAVTSGFQLVFN